MADEDEEQHVRRAGTITVPRVCRKSERIASSVTIRAKLYAAIVMTVLGPVVTIAVALESHGRARRPHVATSRSARRAGRSPSS